ncbi:hypothetical protein M408DRAFT_169257 [Serendipita vermifera MAFF 305830]|uniref:Uncharacterized protein n=1 Tax=Serendipita vermifera MAFF 305830 TaxID=933852 RepID=A0A0C3B791_SERVB|nr:hypothetical protein M408DRAFT_169257 [Serendipita vermifera MAFF 305830]
MMEVTPAEPVSDIDEEEVFASQETQSKPLSFPFKKSGSSALVIFDGQPERRLRSQPAEEKRLLNLVSVLVGKPLVDVTVEVNKLERTGLEEVVCLVFPKSKYPQLDEEQISVLGKAGLAIYQGETQLAGPVPVPQPSTSSQVPGTFDWRAMRKEVMKMKLPWERNDNIDFQASAGPDSPTSMTHSSSSAGLAPSPADLHFRELLRPNLWSASGTFTRMATAGMRWGEFSGVDPDSSSDESDGEEAEQRLETVLHV